MRCVFVCIIKYLKIVIVVLQDTTLSFREFCCSRRDTFTSLKDTLDYEISLKHEMISLFNFKLSYILNYISVEHFYRYHF